MKKTLLVSCVADNYVPLLLDMLTSLGKRINDYDVGIVEFSIPDGSGLSEENKQKIRALKPDCLFAESRWFIDIPKKYKNISNKVYCNKVFSPELFPGYDGYIYVDADIWFSDSSVISEYAIAAGEGGIAISHEHYPLSSPYVTANLSRIIFLRLFTGLKAKAHLIKKHKLFFGSKNINGINGSLVLNGGIFYIRGNHPIWRLWQETMMGLNFNKVLRKYVLCDQGCLQHALLKNNIDYSLMTNHYNWILTWYDSPEELPLWDKKHNCLVDYIYPHTPIKAFHLGGEYMDKEFSIKTTDGDTLKTKLTFSAITSLKNKIHG